MQLILSPAKLMKFDETDENIQTTCPRFLSKTAELVEVCRQLSAEEIAGKMKINRDMARDVYGYFQTFNFKSAPRRAAALAYNGIAYKGLNAHDFSKEDFDFAQRHLNIISGLYGFLRPLDEIRPYRLEFQRKISPKGSKDLYDFWQDTLNAYLSAKLEKDEKVIINVASNEYSQVVRKSKLPRGVKIINIQFLQQEAGEIRQIVVHTKKARGLMSRFIIKNKLFHSEEVKAFDAEGYFFYPPLSNENRWTFVR